MVDPLENFFPKLRGTAYRVTSPRDSDYNCIAWSAGDPEKWWWPVSGRRPAHWPTDAPKEHTLEAFKAAFRTLGYAESGSDDLESDVEKVAVFVDANDVPTHAARQLPSGAWTSKLGIGVDIEHALRDLEGDVYGAVAVILARPRA